MKAVEGCTHVIHVASPVPGDGVANNDSIMIEMAVSGIKAMLHACQVHKVKKLIVTSSVATMNGSAWKGSSNPNYDENDFAIK